MKHRNLISFGFVITFVLAGWVASAAHGAGVFTLTGGLITTRDDYTATLLPNGKVLVAGGNTNDYYPSDVASAELYDPATGHWTVTGSLGVARAYHTATLLPNGQVLVVGGFDDNYNDLASAELYDPATGVWRPTGSLGDARHYHTATLLANGKVLVAGGLDDVPGITATAEVYDPATGAWTSTGSLTDVRVYHTATLLASGQVLVAGGEDFDDILASTELYDPATGVWTSTGSLADVRAWHTATLLANGKVLVAGGEDDNGILATAELYNPATGVWSPTGSLGNARESYSATLLAGGQILVAGGFGLTNGVIFGITLASAELYDPTTGAWSSTGSLYAARYGNTATLLPNGQVLVAGGDSSAELYDPGMSFPSLVKLGDGSFQFGFINASGPSYSVLASPDVAAPMNMWLNLGPATEMPVGSGLFQFTDHQAPNYPQRFYRVSSPQ